MVKVNLIDKIESVLYSGATFSNNGASNDSESSSYSTNYSPNNLKSVIISPEGMILTFHTTVGNQKKLVRRVNFPQTPETFNYMNEEKELLSFLIGKRVYSSVEEIILIAESGYEPMFKLPKRQLTIIQSKILTRLKRLRDVVVIAHIPTSLEDFQRYYEDLLKTDNAVLAENDELISQSGVNVIPINEKWYNAISLRPSYYKLDEVDGSLYKKFHRTKDLYNVPDGVEVKEVKSEQENTNSNELTTKDEKDLEELDLLFNVYHRLRSSNNETYSNIDDLVGGTETVSSYLKGLYSFKEFKIDYVFDENWVKDCPTLVPFDTFLNQHNTSNAVVIKSGEINKIKEYIIGMLVSNIKKIYYQYKKDSADTSKTERMLNLAIHTGFVRLYKQPKYKEFYKGLKSKNLEINRAFTEQIKEFLQFPFNSNLVTSNVVPYKGTYPNSSVNRVLEQVELENNPHYILISILFKISKGYRIEQDVSQSTIEIVHDWLNVVYNLGEGYFERSLSEVNSPNKNRVVFNSDYIWSKMDNMLIESDLEVNPKNHNVMGDSNSFDLVKDNQGDIQTTLLDDLEGYLNEESETSKSELDEEKLKSDFEKAERVIEDELETDLENSSEEMNLPWKPDKGVRMYLTWIDKLEESFILSGNPAIGVLHSSVSEFVEEVKSFIVESELEVLDSESQEYLIETQMTYLSKVVDKKLKIYLNMKKIYFNRLKTVPKLNSLTLTLENGFENYYSLNGKSVKPEDTYEYIKSLYYLIKGRIK